MAIGKPGHTSASLESGPNDLKCYFCACQAVLFQFLQRVCNTLAVWLIHRQVDYIDLLSDKLVCTCSGQLSMAP